MVLALFCAASVSRAVVRSISITALALATTIMLGTIAMSIYECGMLKATLNEVGGTAYIVGNWGMHYYPFVRILLSGTVSYATANPVRQHLAAIATIVVYCTLHSPSAVYGCTPSLPPWAIATFLSSVSLLPAVVYATWQRF